MRKLNRPTGHRMSMLRTMVSQLVKHERIETTVAKAKEIRRLADNMVQLGKEITTALLDLCGYRNQELRIGDLCDIVSVAYLFSLLRKILESREKNFDLEVLKNLVISGTAHAARLAASFVRGDDVMHKLFHEFAYRYKDRAGGYTRLLRTRIRKGDAAPMAYIEYVHHI